jgi:hypothetical protein
MTNDVGRPPSGQALVSDEAGFRLHPAGFDPSRMPYQPFTVEAGQVWRSEGYSMCTDGDVSRDEDGAPRYEAWRFANDEEDYIEGCGWLEVRLHEIVETDRSGSLVVY